MSQMSDSFARQHKHDMLQELWSTKAGRQLVMRNDFSAFTMEMFTVVHPQIKLLWAPYLDLICAMAQKAVQGGCRRFILTMPPRHLKSFCLSVSLPAFFLGHYPGKEVMCVSYAQTLSRQFAKETQKIMTSATYKEIFDEVLVSRRQSPLLLETTQGGGRRATSLDGTATGVGGHLLIFDDPQKAGETFSEAIRDRTNRAFEITFVSRGNDPENDIIIIVMQRLHEDDFVSHVQGLGDEWEVINLPAIAEAEESIPYSTFLGDFRFKRSVGEALHPQHMSLKTLERRRKAHGEAVFATQYQQRPAPAGGGLVKLDWFRRYRKAELPETFDRIVQSWDTANTIAETSAYSVCTTWGAKGRDIYLLHVFRERMIFPDIKRKVLEQGRLWGADQIYVEDKASGVQILQELRSEGFGKLRPVRPVGDKKTRMVNQTALIENGFVHIPEEAPWLQAYLHELEVFPNGRFSDQIDSTSQALDAMTTWANGDGIFEYYRSLATPQTSQGEETWVMKGPQSLTTAMDAKGCAHWVQPDGCFHLKRSHAQTLLTLIGWTRIA